MNKTKKDISEDVKLTFVLRAAFHHREGSDNVDIMIKCLNKLNNHIDELKEFGFKIQIESMHSDLSYKWLLNEEEDYIEKE